MFDKSKFESMTEFHLQVIAQGSFLDSGCEVKAITVRLNPCASNAWIMTRSLNCRDCYETDTEYEAYLVELEERCATWHRNLKSALGIVISENQSFKVEQVQSEVFVIVHTTRLID